MKRVNKILNDKLYIETLKKIEEVETTREFCKHNFQHFIDMARISYIRMLEEGLHYDKEIIYAIGVLHDIGRYEEYKNGIPHHIASVDIAKIILEDKGFKEEEIQIILKGIYEHRKGSDNILGKIVYESDKLSRECYRCKAKDTCNWKEEKKNLKIKY